MYGILNIVSLGSRQDYAAQRLLFRAMQVNRKIARNPDVVPPVMLASVEENLQKIVQSYPKTKVARLARLKLVKFYLQNEKYEQAGRVVEDIVNNYSDLVTLVQQIPNIRLIFEQRLNAPERAIAIYSNMKTKTDDAKLIEVLEKKIRILEARMQAKG